LSRKLLTQLKKTDQGILVNGRKEKVNVCVKAGDRIEVHLPEEDSDHILPQPIPFQRIFEDEHLLIVNKEAGMIVHPTKGHYTHTLANGVVHYWQQKGERCRFHPVHRLDQDTSGVLAIAKNAYAHQRIAEQMKANQVVKEYLALVYGKLPEQAGTIDAPIDKDPLDPRRRTVSRKGYPSITHYRVVEEYGEVSLVRLRLMTGRTHQIRVHMKHAGCPLVGDKMYGPDVDPGTGPNPVSMSRHALHSCRLAFYHPVTGEWLEFAADLPDDMKRLIRRLTI
jgi:23S rRNA pseudouridine1911/1915/1917 synthase